MAIQLIDVIAGVRAHPGLPASAVATMGDDEFAYAVGQLVPLAIHDVVVEALATRKRQYLITDRDTTSLTLDGESKASLDPLIASKGILVEYLNLGEIFHADWPEALSELETGRISNYDNFHACYWLVGTMLYASGEEGPEAPLVGVLSLAVPYLPTLATLNVMLLDDLINRLVMRLRGIPTEKAATK